MENEYNQEHQLSKEFSYREKFEALNIEDIDTLMKAMLSEMKWLLEIVDARIKEVDKSNETKAFLFSQHPVPELPENDSAYTQLVKQFDLGPAERLLLICSILPHLSPEELTNRLRDEKNHMKLKYPEFGGCIDPHFSHYVPTLQTILFLLAGKDKTTAVYYRMVISKFGKLVREGIINIRPMVLGTDDENELQQIPHLTQEYLLYLQSGHQPRPDYGRAFPVI